MSEQAARLLEQALVLSRAEREELVDALRSSLDAPPDEKIAAQHLQEVKSRFDALKRGEFKSIPVDEAFELARRTRGR